VAADHRGADQGTRVGDRFSTGMIEIGKLKQVLSDRRDNYASGP
jgi:hypothetical protein